MKISLCMIVKDEEQVLARCLDSVAPYVDEIVIVDTGSSDDTVHIAERYTSKIHFFAWRDDFAAARNFSFQKAAGDYLMWMDADDVLPRESAARFSALRELLTREEPAMVVCPYETGGTVFYRERFMRRAEQFVWQGRVHECIAPRGKLVRSDVRIVHLGSKKERGTRNLDIYRKWAGEEALGGRDLFYYGRELFYHRLYAEAIAVLERMLRGEGWYVNKIEACRVLSHCYLAEQNPERAISALFDSFAYGEPRAAVLCELGAIFKAQKRYREAVFWYESAMRCRDHSPEGDFEEPACRTVTPALELVFCCWQLGEREAALRWHETSKALAPEHPSVIYNDNFFASQEPRT